MDTYERELLNNTLELIEHLLTRADDRENSLTHAQKHHILQASLIILRDVRSKLADEIWKAQNPPHSDGIPF